MHRRCTWIVMVARENRGADGLPVYWHHWFSMVVFILDEKLRPIVRRKFEKEFEYLRLLVGFADDVDARDVLGRVANHCRTLQSRRVEPRRRGGGKTAYHRAAEIEHRHSTERCCGNTL